MLKLGAVLDGKYKIISVIGQGGMSTVYLARHQRLNKEWAVKEISREYCENYEMISRQLVLEADILKKLNHPPRRSTSSSKSWQDRRSRWDGL